MLASQVDYDDLFKLFMTSKMPNPHYLPEVAIKTTIINFTVTMEGLEDQLLGDVDTGVETSSALQSLVCRGPRVPLGGRGRVWAEDIGAETARIASMASNDE